MLVKVHKFVLFCVSPSFSSQRAYSRTKHPQLIKKKIVRVIKEVAFTARNIPDEALKAALDVMKGTESWQRLIEMDRRIEEFEALCNTPLPNLDNVNEFRVFKQLVRDELDPMNWLKDMVSPKWISFMGDVKDVFSATRADILEKALRESQY